jgi:hypothetical protein
MAQPGPGQVLRFAREVDARRRDADRKKGVRSALSWALGERSEHPLTNEAGNGGQPDMRAIAKAVQEAKAAARRPSRSTPVLSRDYSRGVQDCLSWICGRQSNNLDLDSVLTTLTVGPDLGDLVATRSSA